MCQCFPRCGSKEQHIRVVASARKPELAKGTVVWTWWDTGAFGPTQLRGVIVALGPKTATIEWESSFRNRVRRERIGSRGQPIVIGDPDAEE